VSLILAAGIVFVMLFIRYFIAGCDYLLSLKPVTELDTVNLLVVRMQIIIKSDMTEIFIWLHDRKVFLRPKLTIFEYE